MTTDALSNLLPPQLRGADLPSGERDHDTLTRYAKAEVVVRRIMGLLASRGWCLWRCEALGGEVIAVIDDDLPSGEIPQGYVTYIYSEVCRLFAPDAPPMEPGTLRLIHEAKRLGGVITGREGHEPKGGGAGA